MPSLSRILAYTLSGLLLACLFACSPADNRIEELLDQLVENDRKIDQGAHNALMAIGKPALDNTVKRLLTESNVWKQQYYMALLQDLGDESISKSIVPFVHSESAEVREWAIILLSKYANKDAVGVLIAVLPDGRLEDDIRERVIGRLRMLTEQDIAYSIQMEPHEKLRAISAWQRWWKSQQAPV